MDNPPETVRFYYLKSSQYRVIHADGALGGITPRGLIHMSMYSERQAIPQVEVYSLTPDGVLSEDKETEGKPGIVREMDVDVIMSKSTASALRDWLTKQIDRLEELETEMDGDANA